MPSETHHSSSGYTPLEPPPSILHSVYSAIKDVFSSDAPSTHDDATLQVPPPHPVPEFKPMSWAAVNSYGEPATPDAYPDFDPRNPHPPFDYASSKHSVIPTIHKQKHEGLTPAKIQKINHNLNKLAKYMNGNVQRSSEVLPQFNAQFGEMFKNGQLPLLGTPVVSDNEIGVLPGELLPDPMTTSSTTSTTTTSTTQKPKNITETENTRRKKETRFILRGNKIVQV